ncbi:MAG: glycosyltransferase [Prevotella sp.]|nr:glycosyltransferase [Prevotella sp.]
MRIAILTSGVMPVPAVKGGAVENLIDKYLAYNEQHQLHDITIYSVADKAVIHHPALSSSVNHYRYINPFSLWGIIRKALQFNHHNYYNPSIEFFLHQALQDIRRQHFDVIIVENRPAFILKLRTLTDAHCVLHLHNDFLNSQSKEATSIVKGFDKIICVSDYITQRIPDGKEKSVTVHNAIDVQHFLDSTPLDREAIGLSKDDFVIVYSGRLNEEKGILPLVEAIGTLTDIPRLKLLVVGASSYGNDSEPTPFFRQLQEATAPIKEKIILTGFVDYQQVPSYLKTANIAVVPSLWEEPFGLTVIEAMAAGLPLIATRSGGIPEICEDSALLVERDNCAEHLADAIRTLYHHPEQRLQLSKNAQERSHGFDKESYAKKFFKALTVLLFLLLPLMTSAQSNKLSVWLQEKMQMNLKSDAGTKRRAGDETLTTVFVRTSETLTNEKLVEYGGTIYAQLGDVSIITIPMSQIGRLSEDPTVLRVEANKRADLTLDTIPLVNNILPIYQATPQHQAFTGSGVIMGVVDVGFDLTNPTFYHDKSLDNYRIKAFWDQIAPRDPASTGNLPVGREFLTENDILAQGCATDGESQTHGTHTAGIAAGSGYESPYAGVARESDICLVANAVGSDMAYIAPQEKYLYTSATDALAFKYIFDYAEQQQKPCVVSFSEGYTPYMDDDDLLLNDFLERLIGPGRILVISAGNESRALTYLDKPVGKEQAGAFLKTGEKAPLYRLRSNQPPALTLYAYKDSNTPTHQIQISADDERWNTMFIDTLFIESDTLAIAINSYPSAFDQQTYYMLQLYGNVPLDKMPPIALVVSGEEQQIEVIGSVSNALTTLDTDPQWNDATIGHNILGPGCLKAPIAVGSTTHRKGFRNINGKWVESIYKNEEAGLWSPFSSVGPTLDGRIKPDITAPGRNVISAYSSYYREAHPTATGSDIANTEINGRIYPWHADSGTSMSCPVVAGIIALWLQAKPDLTRDEIMQVLQRTSRHPEEDLDYPNNKYGYGEIDGYAGLLDILGITAIKEVSWHEPHDVSIWAQDGQLHIVFAKNPSKPITLTIYSTAGACVYQTSVSANQQNVSIPLPTLGKGIYAVQLGNLGSTLIRI